MALVLHLERGLRGVGNLNLTGMGTAGCFLVIPYQGMGALGFQGGAVDGVGQDGDGLGRIVEGVADALARGMVAVGRGVAVPLTIGDGEGAAAEGVCVDV